MDEQRMQDKARTRTVAANNALPVLVDRAGGTVTVTRQEFAELAARYGGASRMVVMVEDVAGGEAIRLTLTRKEPEQGSLPQ
jgi:biotin carboxylase